MSDDKNGEPLQSGKRTLDAIIEGVAAKLRESPLEKWPNTEPGSSSKGKGKKKIISPYSTRPGVKLLRGECMATRPVASQQLLVALARVQLRGPGCSGPAGRA